MHLTKLGLVAFKNYENAQFDFHAKINFFSGPNGVGKTNLLDAIYYLSFTKSALSIKDANSIRHGFEEFSLKGRVVMDKWHDELVCAYSASKGRKKIRINGKESSKMLDHIGKYPAVLSTPQDVQIIWGSSRFRRRFFDMLIAQIDRHYLETLTLYVHQLKQRNSLLKRFATKPADHDLLDVYDKKMILTGAYIHRTRRAFIKKFTPLFYYHYNFLTGGKQEGIEVRYLSELTDKNIEQEFKKSRQKDLLLQRTSIGVHRDDFEFLLDGHSLRYTGSQGQQKSFLIGLKIAEFQLIEQKKGFKPLLLLDDIFDKLDDERTDKLLTLIVNDLFGQLFVTDARVGRGRSLLKQKKLDWMLFELGGAVR